LTIDQTVLRFSCERDNSFTFANKEKPMKKLIPIVVVMMIVALVLAACGGGATPSGGAQTAPTEAVSSLAKIPMAEPTEKPEDNATSNATPEALDLANVSSGLGDLNSYKASFNMTFEGKENGQPKTSSFGFTEEFVKEPAAKRTTITGLGSMISGGTPAPDQGSGSVESIEVGGKQYSKLGDICTQVTAENAPQSNTMMDPNSIIGGVRGAQRLGNETVNGVPTVHYKVDASNLNVLGYLNSDGDVWVADPGNYVVKYTLQATATGKDNFFGSTLGEGTIKWDYEVSEVNQPINIQAPENCGGTAEDIPMMDDAKDQASMGGMSTYSTPSKFDEVVAFYEKEMKAKGWAEQDASGMSAEGMSMKNYTKDGRTVQIIITADTSSNTSSVMITEQQQ
jgi:hypothetical protein